MFERIVKAGNGKWHIWEADLGIEPARPVGPYRSVAQPERPIALTICGEEIYASEKCYEYPIRYYPAVEVAARRLGDSAGLDVLQAL